MRLARQPHGSPFPWPKSVLYERANVAKYSGLLFRGGIQKCRAWIVEYIAPSNARATALGKYLVALSKSLEGQDASKPSAKRKRLHLLYIISDVLHHTVAKQHDRNLESALQSHLPGLVANAAAFQNSPKHAQKLERLVELWEVKAYVSPGVLPKLRDALKGSISGSENQEQQTALGSTSLKIAKDAPFVLPSHHGDSSTPWFDLPASTWLPHLTPNSTKPMLPDLIQPIQLASGPADRAVTEAVKALLSDVDRIFSKGKTWNASSNESHLTDTNQLGEMVLIDEVTGDIIGGETYYGWSRQFCEKMRERRRKGKLGNGKEQRSRSRSISYDSRGRSRSSSAPAFKRRRRSSSNSSREDRHRGFRPSSRSPQQHLHVSLNRHSGSRSRSRSRSKPRTRDERPRSPDRRYMSQDQKPPPIQGHSYPAVAHLQHHNFPHIPQTGTFPPPPPPPAGYQGPWPPPPPPPPVAGRPMPNWLPGPGFIPPTMGGWNPNAPPPPPPPQYQQGWGSNQQSGNGGRGNGYSSRADHGRGRGRW